MNNINLWSTYFLKWRKIYIKRIQIQKKINKI